MSDSHHVPSASSFQQPHKSWRAGKDLYGTATLFNPGCGQSLKRWPVQALRVDCPTEPGDRYHWSTEARAREKCAGICAWGGRVRVGTNRNGPGAAATAHRAG